MFFKQIYFILFKITNITGKEIYSFFFFFRNYMVKFYNEECTAALKSASICHRVTPFRSVLSPLPGSTVLAQPQGHPHAEHSPALGPPGPRSWRGREISHPKVKRVLT